MRLLFEGIEAGSHEEAAAIASRRSREDADFIDDCHGDDFAALVDVTGADSYEQSRFIAFEAERLRQAAPKLLEALIACELQLREYVRRHHVNVGGCSVEIEDAWEQARDALAAARAGLAGGV
jgi:hypothetical protein